MSIEEKKKKRSVVALDQATSRIVSVIVKMMIATAAFVLSII